MKKKMTEKGSTLIEKGKEYIVARVQRAGRCIGCLFERCKPHRCLGNRHIHCTASTIWKVFPRECNKK
jgi:hypothetical protein